jgi:hypothetical protein
MVNQLQLVSGIHLTVIELLNPAGALQSAPQGHFVV